MPKARNAQVRENYALLRGAGFSAKEANRLKGAGRDTVAQAVATGRTPTGKLARGRGASSWERLAPDSDRAEMSGRITYTEAGEGDNPVYLAAYSYVFTYVVKVEEKVGGRPVTTYERKYLTVQTDEKATKAEVMKRAYEILRKYEVDERAARRAGSPRGKVIKDSLQLVSAVRNSDFI